MKYDSRIHTKAYLAKSLIWQYAKLLPGMQAPEGDLVVLNYHSTHKRFLKNFEAQVRFFRDHYRIISPSQLQDYFEDSLEATDRSFLLFNFDDGIKNNLYAAEVLYKYGICAFFFVVPEFINTRPEVQGLYFRENVRTMINPHIDVNSEDLTAMSWCDLKEIIKVGHEVGSHTATHSLRVASATLTARKYEIVESQCMIAEALGLELAQVRAFCGPKDSLLSVGSLEMAMIRQHYDFFFSSFAGSNCVSKNPYFIKRVNVEAFWMLGTVKFALSNLNRMRWRGKVRAFERVLEDSGAMVQKA